MTVLVAVGVMNVGHGGAGSVIFVEKLSRYGKLFGQTVGVATGGDLSPGDLVSVAASWPARLRHADDVRQAGLLFQDVQQLPAGLLTAPAGLLTEPAMLVTLGMPLTLVAAALTDGHASLQQQPGETGVEFPLAARQPDGGGADIARPGRGHRLVCRRRERRPRPLRTAMGPPSPHQSTRPAWCSSNATPANPTRCHALCESGREPLAAYLARFDIVVNCVLQDTAAPLMFVTDSDLAAFSPGSLIIDVSRDTGMGSAGHDPHHLRTGCSPWAAAFTTTPWTTALRCCGTPPPGRSATPAATPKDRTRRPPRTGPRPDHQTGHRNAREHHPNPTMLAFQHRATQYPHPRFH